jgi:hypothetical protein
MFGLICYVFALEHNLVDVAPAPVFARLEGLNDRVIRCVKMLRRMLVFGRIAAADVPANEAYAQMHPGIAGLQAILTSVRAGGNVSNLIEVCTLLSHFRSFSYLVKAKKVPLP